MQLNLTADEVLTTTRSVRKRLDFDRPVERSVVLECLDIALQAPTGSNRQGWQWMVIGDEEKKKAIAALYKKNFDWYTQQPGAEYDPDDTRTLRRDHVRSSADHLSENFHRAPFLVIPLIEGRMGPGMESFAQASVWGSILPAVWSFMLALRGAGAGFGLDHPPPARRGGGGRDPRHPVRSLHPGRPVSGGLHQGHRLQAGGPGFRRPS